jgi:hypothetical protein
MEDCIFLIELLAKLLKEGLNFRKPCGLFSTEVELFEDLRTDLMAILLLDLL